jgi:MbtH protein
MSSIDNENQQFQVVVNVEGQYSIWPDFRDLPAGWNGTGFQGLKKECLDHIAVTWLDMRPRSLQQLTEDTAGP